MSLIIQIIININTKILMEMEFENEISHNNDIETNDDVETNDEYDDIKEIDDILTEINDEQKMYSGFYVEKNNYVNVYYIYVDTNNNITYAKKDTEELINGMLKKEKLIMLLKNNMLIKGKKCGLMSIIKYNININNNELTHFLKDEEKYNFLTYGTKIDDMYWEDTILSLQELNGLFIVYKESPKQNKRRKTKKKKLKIRKKLKNKYTRKRV